MRVFPAYTSDYRAIWAGFTCPSPFPEISDEKDVRISTALNRL